MALAQSKVTSQGQISIPAEIRKKLGIGPGSVLEWEDEGSKIVLRRAQKSSSLDLHRAAFPDGPPKHSTVKEMKESIAEYLTSKNARY